MCSSTSLAARSASRFRHKSRICRCSVEHPRDIVLADRLALVERAVHDEVADELENDSDTVGAVPKLVA
jgi:hypothetical protein